MENVEKKSFEERVMEFLKGGDKKRLSKFKKGIITWAKDQIKEINARIEKNRDRLEESEDNLDEYLLAVELSRITNTDDRDEYVLEYVSGYDKMIADIDQLKENIVDDRILVGKREALILKMK